MDDKRRMEIVRSLADDYLRLGRSYDVAAYEIQAILSGEMGETEVGGTKDEGV